LTASILIIDDEYEMRNLLSRILARKGYQVSQASSGIDALALLENTSPDVVLLDFAMPGINGVEVLRHIRQLPPPNQPKVIALTAHTDFILEARQYGLDASLLKPVPPDVLLETIRRQL